LPNRRIAAPAVEPKQFAPVAIVFRTAGKDGVTTERLRRCDAVSQATNFAFLDGNPKGILAMTVARLVLASAPDQLSSAWTSPAGIAGNGTYLR